MNLKASYFFVIPLGLELNVKNQLVIYFNRVFNRASTSGHPNFTHSYHYLYFFIQINLSSQRYSGISKKG